MPNNKQASHFAQASGVARLSYNWALREWQRQYKADKEYRDQCEYYDVAVNEMLLNRPKGKRPLNPIPILIRFRFPAVWQ
ncbi:helix-turn-helix domain-containing protein [Acinetobacter towneri]|uniref:helix-turn-helix domain-containing protein n=1 Tax=Acinetobacter towneri TaxID=202956 RepID=UPI003A8974E7